MCKGVDLKPDFIVNDNQGVQIICDCKYKLNWRFTNSDVYQMLAYLEGFQRVRNAVIIHPESNTTGTTIEHIDYPRSGRLYRIGIPITKLTDSDNSMWKNLMSTLVKII